MNFRVDMFLMLRLSMQNIGPPLLLLSMKDVVFSHLFILYICFSLVWFALFAFVRTKYNIKAKKKGRRQVDRIGIVQ